MSPYEAIHDYPRWAEIAVRTTRILGYAFAAMTGLAAVIFTPASITPATIVIVASMGVFGLLCLAGSLFQKYIIEWISLFFLTGGICVYVMGIWITAFSNTRVIAAASMFTFLVLLLSVRLIDLTVYWWKNVKAASIVKELSDD